MLKKNFEPYALIVSMACTERVRAEMAAIMEERIVVVLSENETKRITAIGYLPPKTGLTSD